MQLWIKAVIAIIECFKWISTETMMCQISPFFIDSVSTPEHSWGALKD